MKQKSILIIMIFLLGAFFLTLLLRDEKVTTNPTWSFQSIDTMKQSRDLAREKLNDPTYEQAINQQMTKIAKTGATHVAIGTPYDEEFRPYLRLWVAAAREQELNIWFRGNWSGWEQWFGYEAINRKTHIAKTEQFILDNSDLFADGDAFSSCPECENGPEFKYGNPEEVRHYRQFLIDEYNVTKAAFAKIDKDVASNYFSMNADVAKAVMNPETTRALDGLVVIDHYVDTPEQLVRDVTFIAEQSGGRIVLGEIGAPIPDIHGQMTDEEQKAWIAEALVLLAPLSQLEGINYWTHMGGTTELWRADGSAKPVLEPLTATYRGKNKKPHL